MVGIGGCVIIALVTADTSVWRIRVARAVAAVAIVGNRCMCAKQWMNGVMVKACRNPCILRMALRAVSRELCGSVIGVACVVIIRLMTSQTRVWSIREISVDVTAIAIIRDSGMSAMQRVNRVVVKR